VLGGSGMLGHKAYQVLQTAGDVWCTVRTPGSLKSAGLFRADRVIEGVDFDQDGESERAIDLVRPDAVVNCVGVVKQSPQAQGPLASITTNSLLPHRLARACSQRGARLIHISTDCVFSGRVGNYSEADLPDPPDLYGRSKLLGEVDQPEHLTIRTSMIGRELHAHRGLLDWFLAQSGTVKGFSRAVFSGLTTLELARVLAAIILEHQELSGIYHVSAEPIDKFRLLTLIREVYGREIEIREDAGVVIDRSLDSTRFRRATGWTPPSWPVMIAEMMSDPTAYPSLEQLPIAY
jgi:dTDP-4-dehydrorhamnose reductase